MTIRVGIIGLGVMGRRMAQRMTDHGGFEVRAGWDPDPAAFTQAAGVAPGMDGAADVAALCARPDLDLIHVASPPAAHVGQCLMALEAGKAVLCEKPLAIDPMEGEVLAARADGPRTLAAVNFPLASSAALAVMAGELADGAIGAVRGAAISVGFRQWPRPWQADAAPWLDGRAQGGFTREVVSHFLFVLRRLLGPLEVVESRVAFGADGGAERDVQATLVAGGVQVHLTGHVGRIAAEDKNETVIVGERGAFRLVDWRHLERADRGSWAPVRAAKDQGPPGFTHLDAVADWLGGRPHPLATVREALDVQRAVEELVAGVAD